MQLRRDFLRSIEAGFIGLFLIQSMRFLYGTLYAHISSADLVRRIADPTTLRDFPGYVDPSTVERELFAVGIALLAPLLGLVLARTQWSIPLAVAMCVVGRSMALQIPDSAALAAALVVGSALLYMVLTIIRRPFHFPSMLLIGIALDQLIRAAGRSWDHTWNPTYEYTVLGYTTTADNLFLGITVLMLVITGYTTLVDIEASRMAETPEKRGTLTGWGSLALGSFFFMELTLLGLANAVAHWAEIDYRSVVPWLLLATTLPLVPAVRVQARIFLSAFDGIWRGWLWTLLLGLLLVLGNRFEDLLAMVMLVLAQFIAALTLWWVVKVRDEGSVVRYARASTASEESEEEEESSLPNGTPILMMVSVIVFAILSTGDYFTYDYAFVRDFAAPFDFLEEILRSMKGLGLQLFLFASLILCMPIILERRVIPWRGGRAIESWITIMLAAAISLNGIQITPQTGIQELPNVNCLRVASLNIHSGFTLLFGQNLQEVADLIEVTGADVVLLQEVDAGRMSSYGIDQGEWLAHELGMELNYFPLNESLSGLAVLSKVPISASDAEKLTSTGAQAGVQHLELALDELPLHIYNLWFGFQTTDANGLPLPFSEQDQLRQHEEMKNIIFNNHSPNFDDRIIMGGTFNYDTDTVLYNDWDKDTTFEDPFQSLAIERAKTIFLVDGTSARFDYIWVMNMVQSGVGIDLNNVVSDHRLIVVQVNRTPEQTCR
jgi:exonuclease III